MSDAKSNIGGQVRQTIDPSRECEIRDWAKKFGVTENALRRAVERVGVMVVDVQRELGGRR